MTGETSAARGFAAEHAHYTEDLPLWTAVAARADGPVLDLGCAAGRVSIALAEAGVEVWAVDHDPHMLAEVAHRAAAAGAEVAARIRTVPADLRALELGVRVPLAIAAMNTLQLLLTPDDQLACLAGVRAHLAEGGEFWFDVSMPDIADLADSVGLVRAGAEYDDPDTGERLIQSSWYDSWDPVSHTAEFTIRVDRIGTDGLVRTALRRHAVHLFTPPELHHLLARAGFAVVQAWGGFAGEPLEDGASHQVMRCRVADEPA